MTWNRGRTSGRDLRKNAAPERPMSLTSYRFLGATKFRFLGDTLRPEIRMAQSHNPAHGFKNCINNTPHCGVDVARDYQSHAGRNTCCTLGSGAFVTRKSVHHTCHLRVFAGSPTRRTVDMTQHMDIATYHTSIHLQCNICISTSVCEFLCIYGDR